MHHEAEQRDILALTTRCVIDTIRRYDVDQETTKADGDGDEPQSKDTDKADHLALFEVEIFQKTKRQSKD
jgi:hypothetical protein